ncbi:kinase-like domain-containing protein [Suillus subalutaceus]|uniref:kinase-like domain-containing protein n=1 Tax=Suillus subalutaceus TaxID=48586 RepID=UPI001B876A5D|nr:kinase-like domain-containing protein [Suillus subalutaceus]KAG1870694.1 kinase-like domain-containing protein [Suillus subalutaceus]
MVIAGSEATTFQSECRDRYRWMAPEKFGIQDEEGGEQLTKTAEVYSYGCIMIMLFSGHRPYHSKQDSNDIILAGLDRKEPFEQFGGLDDDPKLKELAQQCLLRSGERPPLSRIIDLLTRRINVSNAMNLLLLELQPSRPMTAMVGGSISGTLRYNWLHGSDATVVAVKTLDVGDLNDINIDKTCDMIRREVNVRERLKHETILDLYGMTTGFGVLPSFVYPWMAHGSLHDYLKREFSTLSPLQKFDILYQVADGIKYLHKNNIAHGNLTGDNVLLDDAARVRIADFSRSVILGDTGVLKSSKQLPGAARYVSPESVVRDEQTGPPQPTKSQDVYSYGCITILVLSGKVPYWWISEESEVLSEKVKGTEPFLTSVEIDRVHLDLVRRCLSMLIESRPCIEKVLCSVLVQRSGALDLTSLVQRLNEAHQASGGFSNVHMCTLHASMSNAVHVAVKEMRLGVDANMSTIINRLFREIKIWMRLEHENIVPFLGVTEGFGSLPALVSPWFKNGVLTEYLQREHETLSYSQKFALLRDVARGLQYLHSQSTIHGDPTGNNILVDQNGKASLTDFGLSSFLPGPTSEALPLFPTNPTGVMAYLAPEYLVSDDDGNPPLVRSTASDVYAFGGIMLLTLEGRDPYHYIKNQITIMMQRMKGITPKRPSKSVIGDAEWDFIQRCWLKDMDGRPLDSEILTFVERRAG